MDKKSCSGIGKLAVDAMELIVEWDKMYEFCMPTQENPMGKKCKDCPYNKNYICTRESTADVLRKTANVFREFLED